MLLDEASHMQSSSIVTMTEEKCANSFMQMTHSWQGTGKIENSVGCEMEQQGTLLMRNSKAIRRWRGIQARGEKKPLF